MVKFRYDGFYVDDERIPVYSGAVHYWRLDPEKWGEILDKVKKMGFEVVTTYIPWEIHEIREGVFDFGEKEPSKDIGKYLTICEEKGLKVLVRPGPQINSELTWFGYPKRILEDSEIQARSAQNTKAVLTQVPRPIPALSYASEKFFKETAEWYDVICSILRKHKAPKGCIMGVQVDNELGYFFHINPYVVDYSNSSIKKYQEFLREKYQTIENLNGLYRTNYESFEEIDPPRRFEGRKKEDLPYYIDWIEYREHYLINSLDRLTGMMRERGLDDVPIFHNYPHPLGPGGSVGATTTPFNLPELERKLDFVGFDIYSRKELYDHIKTIVSYVVGCSRFPFIPEFIAGVWPWYFRPGELNDEEFVTKSALMHGIKGFSRYMIVERNRWMGSPVTRDGRIREDRYNFFKQVNEVLKKHSFADFKKKSEIMLISNRDYDRLEAATVLIPFPGDFLETLLGFSEYPNFTTVSEDNFGFDGPIQLAKTKWFDAYYRGLTEQGYSFVLGDTSLSTDKLEEYKVLVLASFEYMSSDFQENLLDFARGGGVVVLGPKIPTLDEKFHEKEILKKYLSPEKSVGITLGDKTVGVKHEVGKGSVVHLPELDKRESGRILGRILEDAGIWKIEKNDPRIDVTIHENIKEPERRIVFVANPTSDKIPTEIGLDKVPASVREIWENKAVEIKDGKLVDELHPYTIRIYDCAFGGV